ncbi:hypothetical protein [Butyrivibrio sp.]|uniref:hypothetical protein n=1 Tax=Butyrivibrio sp. TaxID=28121 RepID=UPI002ED61C00
MKKASKQLMALSVVAAITFSSLSIDAYASSNKVTSVLPQAGITYALGNNQVSLSNLQQAASEETSEAESKEESSVESVSSTAEKDIEASSAVTNETPSASTITDNILRDIQNATGAVISNKEDSEGEESEEASEEESFKSLVIAKVNDYVNVRDLPSEEDGEIIGKLYDKSVGYFIEE